MTCAHAVSVAYKKIRGVEAVDVRLKEGLAKITLLAGNTTAVEQFWISAKANGFVAKETMVVVRGEVIGPDGKVQLRVPGIERPYELTGQLEAVRKLQGQTVELEGTMTPGKTPTTPVPIQVRTVRPAPERAP